MTTTTAATLLQVAETRQLKEEEEVCMQNAVHAMQVRSPVHPTTCLHVRMCACVRSGLFPEQEGALSHACMHACVHTRAWRSRSRVIGDFKNAPQKMWLRAPPARCAGHV